MLGKAEKERNSTSQKKTRNSKEKAKEPWKQGWQRHQQHYQPLGFFPTISENSSGKGYKTKRAPGQESPESKRVPCSKKRKWGKVYEYVSLSIRNVLVRSRDKGFGDRRRIARISNSGKRLWPACPLGHSEYRYCHQPHIVQYKRSQEQLLSCWVFKVKYIANN